MGVCAVANGVLWAVSVSPAVDCETRRGMVEELLMAVAVGVGGEGRGGVISDVWACGSIGVAETRFRTFYSNS